MNNPVLASMVVYQLIVAGYYYMHGGFFLGSLFVVYAVANAIMLFMKIQ